MCHFCASHHLWLLNSHIIFLVWLSSSVSSKNWDGTQDAVESCGKSTTVSENTFFLHLHFIGAVFFPHLSLRLNRRIFCGLFSSFEMQIPIFTITDGNTSRIRHTRWNANASYGWQLIRQGKISRGQPSSTDKLAYARRSTFRCCSSALYRKLMDSNELMLMVGAWAIPLVGSRGKMVNYWMQKCDPALMDAEWDNEEANSNRNIRQREQQRRALYLGVIDAFWTSKPN